MQNAYKLKKQKPKHIRMAYNKNNPQKQNLTLYFKLNQFLPPQSTKKRSK